MTQLMTARKLTKSEMHAIQGGTTASTGTAEKVDVVQNPDGTGCTDGHFPYPHIPNSPTIGYPGPFPRPIIE